MTDNKLKKNLNSSGFPFQLAVESAIKNLPGWKVARREYPWHNHDTGEGGFIDLIAEKDSSTLIVECKRVRDAEWIFLCWPQNLSRSHARFWVNKVGGNKQAVGWYDGQAEPPSPEAEFCAVMGQDHKKPLLETLASELVSATEAFAAEERPFFEDIAMSMSYFPVIITTAKLFVYEINVPDIDIELGEVNNAEFKPAQFVRFRKSLTTASPAFAISREIRVPEDLAEARQRTVFVLNASYIKDILGEWEISGGASY